jgi:hypothetical protein
LKKKMDEGKSKVEICSQKHAARWSEISLIMRAAEGRVTHGNARGRQVRRSGERGGLGHQEDGVSVGSRSVGCCSAR